MKAIVARIGDGREFKPLEFSKGETLASLIERAGLTLTETDRIEEIGGVEHDSNEPAQDNKTYLLVHKVKSGN